MSAPTFAELFQLESLFEQSFKAILQTALSGVNVYISRETLVFETPCVEVKIINGDVNIRHQFNGNPQNAPIYDSWDSALEVRVKTNRGTNGAQHPILCGKVRAALTMFSLIETFPGTPADEYHALTDIREQRGDSAFDDLTNVDTTVMPFYLLFNVDSNAWPAGT
jgi:hypothetical protein